MIKSMTGYGKAAVQISGKNISVEIKSLNSKSFDLSIKLPTAFKEREMEFRAVLSQQLERGKIEFTVTLEKEKGEKERINSTVIKAYIEELKRIEKELQLPSCDYLNMILQMPDVYNLPEEFEITDKKQWEQFSDTMNVAINEFTAFRLKEGKNLQLDITERVGHIQSLLGEVETLAPLRIENLRNRLQNSLKEMIIQHEIDTNRFEQELIYYIEKMDITEESVRLKSHCNYFMEILQETCSNGRKLSFILQEMGREINTIGSKAGDAEIQKKVVRMKDELEKMKEQMLNVL